MRGKGKGEERLTPIDSYDYICNLFG